MYSIPLTRRLETAIATRKSRVLPNLYYSDINEGIVHFVGLNGTLRGNLLVDRTLESSLQVVNYDIQPVDVNYIDAALKQAWAHRKHMVEAGHLLMGRDSAFRAVNQVQDGFPGIAIDIYGNFALIHLFSKHWSVYLKDFCRGLLKNRYIPVDGVYLADHHAVRQREINLEEADPEDTEERAGKKFLTEQLNQRLRERKLLGTSSTNVDKSKTRNTRSLLKVPSESICVAGKSAPNHQTVVKEDGISYTVHLNRGIGTGLDLSLRNLRKRIPVLVDQVKAYKNENQQFIQQLSSNSIIDEIEQLDVDFIEEESKQPNQKPQNQKKKEKDLSVNLLSVFAGSCSLAIPAAVKGASTTNLEPSSTKLTTGDNNFKINSLPLPYHRYEEFPTEEQSPRNGNRGDKKQDSTNTETTNSTEENTDRKNLHDQKQQLKHQNIIHRLWHKEAFRGLYSFDFERKSFDIVVLDPPTVTWVKLDGRTGPPVDVLADNEKYSRWVHEFNKVTEAARVARLKQKQKEAKSKKNPNLQADEDEDFSKKRKKRKNNNQKNNKKDNELIPKIKPAIYTFRSVSNYDDLILMGGSLVAPGGYLVVNINTGKEGGGTSISKETLLSQIQTGFDRLHSKMQKRVTEKRMIYRRQNLRHRGFKKKERLKLLQDYQFEPTIEEIKELYNFQLVEEVPLPPDFQVLQQDAGTNQEINDNQEMEDGDDTSSSGLSSKRETISQCTLIWQRKPQPPKKKKQKKIKVTSFTLEKEPQQQENQIPHIPQITPPNKPQKQQNQKEKQNQQSQQKQQKQKQNQNQQQNQQKQKQQQQSQQKQKQQQKQPQQQPSQQKLSKKEAKKEKELQKHLEKYADRLINRMDIAAPSVGEILTKQVRRDPVFMSSATKLFQIEEKDRRKQDQEKLPLTMDELIDKVDIEKVKQRKLKEQEEEYDEEDPTSTVRKPKRNNNNRL